MENSRRIPIGMLYPNIGQVEGLPRNPRFVRDPKYKKLLQSIEDDPEMLELRELIVYDTGDTDLGYVVVGGNMRLAALRELGYKECPCKVLHTGFPVEKMRRIALKDNSSFGETDFKALVDEWGMDEIEMAAIDVPEIYVPEIVPDEPPAETMERPVEKPVETPLEAPEPPRQRLESKGEVDVEQFEVKQTLSLRFTPEEYMYVIGRLREYGEDYSQSLLVFLGYGGEVEF